MIVTFAIKLTAEGRSEGTGVMTGIDEPKMDVRRATVGTTTMIDRDRQDREDIMATTTTQQR
jgi:hypothetical protein